MAKVIYTRIQYFADLHKAWKYLEKLYKQTSIRKAELAHNRFERIQFNNFRIIQEYLNKLKATKLDIEELGSEVIDTAIALKLVCRLVGSLDYKDFIYYVYIF